MPRYYELVDDRYHPGRWHLRSPQDDQGQKINPWQFFEGRPLIPSSPLHFPVKPDGVELDFSWASFSIPVVHGRFLQLCERMRIQEVQFLPVQVEGHTGPHYILNTLHILRCIDEARCAQVQHFTPEDQQPERVGEYKFVSGLRIDPSRVDGSHLFRPWGWTLSLIVSEELKLALEREGLSGLRFTEC